MGRLLLSIFTGVTLLSGCTISQKVETGGDWVGYDHIYFCPAYCFSEQGQPSKSLHIIACNHISNIDTNFTTTLDVVEAYIRARGGQEYSTNSKFAYAHVTYLDSAENFRNKHPQYDTTKCGETKYYVRFQFSPKPNVNYRMGFALDKRNQIISSPNFPKGNSNFNPANVISPSEAFRIAKRHNKKIVIPTESIELVYDSVENCFVWDIVQEMKPQSKSGKVPYGFMEINAHTGEIMQVGTRTGMVLINPSF